MKDLLTVGELKEIIKDLPDDLIIRIQNNKYGSELLTGNNVYRDSSHIFGDCLLLDTTYGQYGKQSS